MSDRDDSMDEVVREFLVESAENLDQLDRDLVSLEKDPTSRELLGSVFRAVHTIKGTTGFLGFSRLEQVAHKAENLLSKLRDGVLQLDTDRTTVLLDVVDVIRGLLARIEASGNDDDGRDLTELLERLSALQVPGETSAPVKPRRLPARAKAPDPAPPEATGAGPAGVAEAPVAAVQPAVAVPPAPTPEVPAEIAAALAVFPAPAAPAPEVPAEIAAALALSPTPAIQTASARPASQAPPAASITTTPILAAVAAALSSPGPAPAPVAPPVAPCPGSPAGLEAAEPPLPIGLPADVTEPPPDVVSAIQAALAATPHEAPNVQANLNIPQEALAKRRAGAAESGPVAGPSVSERTVRVDVDLLETLMRQVGELVLARNQLISHAGELADGGRTLQRLSLIVSELQEDVMKTRMQPVEQLWSKLPRVVRDLAKQFGKEVTLSLSGGETELDRSVLEAVKDPLTHLVRNAVDHGIEAPDVREAAGKPKVGTIALSASHQGGLVILEMSDDGAGIDSRRVAAKALSSGLVTEGRLAGMSTREITDLVFQPGFSTAEVVTNVSGRGVGMDVVRTNIEKIGGTVDLTSAPGVGTNIRVKIPLTLAIIPALLVSSRGARYAVPQAAVRELVRLEDEALHSQVEVVDGALIYRLRGRLLPLLRLDHVLGHETRPYRAQRPGRRCRTGRGRAFWLSCRRHRRHPGDSGEAGGAAPEEPFRLCRRDHPGGRGCGPYP